MTSTTTAAPPRATFSDLAKNYCHWILSAALGAAFAGDLLWGQPGGALEAVLLALAAGATLTALSRQMPVQNVLLGMVITAVIGSLAHGLSAWQGWAIPFGPIFFHDTCGAKLLDWVPWPIPLFWIAAVFSSRGTARVILRPWRKLKNYGYWLIGLTVLLVMAFDVALEPFAAGALHLWSWQQTKIPVTWYGASPLDFIGWGSVALLILAFATPALIKKKPGSRSPLDLSPLAVWLGAVALFAARCGQAGLWPAVGADAAIALLTLGFAIPGARW